MAYLALLLMAPWLAILGWTYWYFPRRPQPARRRRHFDVAALLVAVSSTIVIALRAYRAHADAGRHVDALGRHAGAIWQQVLPALEAYAAFVAVLLVALALRSIIWRYPH